MGFRLDDLYDKHNNATNDINNLNNMHTDNNYNDIFLGDETLVSYNFALINDELKMAKSKGNGSLDETSGVSMYQMDIGLKNFTFECTNINNDTNKTLHNFSPRNQLLLMKFTRNNSKDLMSMDEIKQYIDIKDCNIVFLQKVDSEMIYKITKSLNNEFYFIVNSQDNVIPLLPYQAESIFKRGQDFSLNSNMHIGYISDDKNNKQKSNAFQVAFYNWFCRNVHHMHPYAYSDMVIDKEVKNYSFKKIENGHEITVKTQFSNELTDKAISLNTVGQLKDFALKCHKARFSALNNNEEYVFAMPFPLYSKNHMLSLVLVFKPDGKVNATIINANGYKDAKYRYAIPIGSILQKVFERFSPDIGENINYFFHENSSQYDGTCMTHADYITKRLVKDRNIEFDGSGVHPIKIWEKAYIRGFATTLYQHAKEQKAFIQNQEKIKYLTSSCIDKNCDVNYKINTDKFSRDFNALKKNKQESYYNDKQKRYSNNRRNLIRKKNIRDFY